ncbi:MAG: VOC family protein [Bacteroidetes bacterium]|nr:VOC family protein [Bacteroidota bacterium]
MPKNLSPYLNFDNNTCKAAMQFYKDCLGGELFMQTVGESPMAEQMPHLKDAIMHSHLKNGVINIMGSDMIMGKAQEGNTVHLCMDCSSEEETKTYFDKLSAGGTIVQPLQSTFWGALFGMFTDKFGKQWMLNYTKEGQ